MKAESSPILGKKRSPIEELERVVKKEGLLNSCKKTAADILENNKVRLGLYYAHLYRRSYGVTHVLRDVFSLEI